MSGLHVNKVVAKFNDQELYGHLYTVELALIWPPLGPYYMELRCPDYLILGVNLYYNAYLGTFGGQSWTELRTPEKKSVLVQGHQIRPSSTV